VILTGTVSDPSGASLETANVFLIETLEGAMTDARGAFVLRTRRSGTGTLAVQLFGYKAHASRSRSRRDRYSSGIRTTCRVSDRERF
jgi:hypothetical protein